MRPRGRMDFVWTSTPGVVVDYCTGASILHVCRQDSLNNMIYWTLNLQERLEKWVKKKKKSHLAHCSIITNNRKALNSRNQDGPVRGCCCTSFIINSLSHWLRIQPQGSERASCCLNGGPSCSTRTNAPDTQELFTWLHYNVAGSMPIRRHSFGHVILIWKITRYNIVRYQNI